MSWHILSHTQEDKRAWKVGKMWEKMSITQLLILANDIMTVKNTLSW